MQARLIRILILVGGSLACVALNYWLVSTGHYRLPLFVVAAFLLIVVFAFRMLLMPQTSASESRINLLKVSTSLRQLGFIGVIGFMVWALTSSRSDFKDMPTWGIVLLYVWGVFVVGAYFWGAKWYKRKADALSADVRKDER